MLVRKSDVDKIAAYDARKVGEVEIPFIPGRVVLQDFTGVPAVVDLAAMRSAIVRMTGRPDPAMKINPGVSSDLVIDHSVQVDAFNSRDALVINSRREFERNQERYEFLKWGQGAFSNFRVVPPATGIVHQVNLEYLAHVVWDDGEWLFPDSLVGTDSHTTMINGLGVVGWGVGGIEAEAAMLGQPISMLLPEVIGFRLTGRLSEGATATDLVLRVTEMLRAHGVVGKFVEFYRSRARRHAGRQPGHDRQHGAGVWSHHRLLPGGQSDPRVPPVHRTVRGSRSDRRAVLPTPGPLARRPRRDRLHVDAGTRHVHRATGFGGTSPAPGSDRPRRHEEDVERARRLHLRTQRRHGRGAP